MNYERNSLPEVEHFGIEEMGEEERHRFLSWHNLKSQRIKDAGTVYSLHQEMIKYCYDDCLVLVSAFLRFNESMIKE